MTTRRTPLMDISNSDMTSSPADAGKRRKSGRAIRVPDKFIPDPPPSQPAPTNSKRKRGGDEAEDDASEIDEDAEASDATVESAAEEEVREIRRNAKKTKKPAAKKPKVKGTTSHDEAPAIQLPSRSKKGGRKVALAERGVDGLYADVYTSGDTSEVVVSRWLESYGQEKSPAMQAVVNLTLRSAGCKLEVTEQDIDDPDNADSRLADIQDQFQAQNITDYPLISKAKSTHDFRVALTSFFGALVESVHQSKDLYANDGVLIQNLEAWVAPMSSSTSRPFRHTATVVAMAILTALCRVAHGEIENSAKIQRQLAGEKKAKRPNAGRVAEFQNKVNVLNFQEEIVERDIKSFFDTVYVHRYRDIDPKIRMECVEGLGTWILTLPSKFLAGEYLRYLGWMLSDTHGPMRQEVVKQLQKILKKSDLGGIRHFIERFRPRLIEMATRDSEAGVRASTVELLNMVREAQMLEPDDIDIIGKLIFDSEPRVRKALVPFFVANVGDAYDLIVEELGGEEALDGVGVIDDDDDDSPRPDWIKYKCLVESLVAYDSQDSEEMPSQIDSGGILHATGIESRFTLAANALFDNIPELRNWQTIAGYLLFDHTSHSRKKDNLGSLKAAFKPTEKEELVLLEILNACVKLSLSHVDELDKGKGKQAKAEKLELQENAARHLAGLIPRLLKKYGADPKTATVVLRLEHVLNLNVFQQLRQDSTVYAKLLDEISAQFNSHADRSVLTEASAALLHARGYEELEEVTESKMQSLWEDTTSRLHKINKAGDVSVRGSLRPKILTELSHNLARIEQLSSISSSVESMETESGTGEPTPIAILLNVIARGVYSDVNDEDLDALEDVTVQYAIRSAMFYFMWKIRDVSQLISSGEEIPDVDIDQIKDWQELCITNLLATFSSRSTLDSTRVLTAGTYLDLHVLFSNNLKPIKKPKTVASGGANNYEYFQALFNEVDPGAQQELTSIFDQMEKAFAKKTKKKLAEPGDDEDPEDLDSEPEDDDAEDITNDEQEHKSLIAEQQLCEFTGKLVLAVIAGVIDASGPLKGKLRQRLQRNRLRLGHNFKEVIAYLDEPKSKSKKSHKSKAQQEAAGAKKSAEVVVDEESDEEDDPFAEAPEAEMDEEPEPSIDENAPAENGAENDEDDDIMGD